MVVVVSFVEELFDPDDVALLDVALLDVSLLAVALAVDVAFASAAGAGGAPAFFGRPCSPWAPGIPCSPGCREMKF